MEYINRKVMEYSLTKSTEYLFKNLEIPASIKRVIYSGDEEKHHMFFVSKTEAKHLLVAHLDTVTELDEVLHMGDKVLANRGLDDRLGLYTCLYLQSVYKCFDILLTDNEEMCSSTAYSFNSADYRAIFEFDRGGVDQFVMYDDCTDLSAAITASTGYVEQCGSYSDIADLYSSAGAVNWCVAYRDYHSDKSHVMIDEYIESISAFEDFFEENKHLEFSKDSVMIRHNDKVQKWSGGGYYGKGYTDLEDSYDNDTYWKAGQDKKDFIYYDDDENIFTGLTEQQIINLPDNVYKSMINDYYNKEDTKLVLDNNEIETKTGVKNEIDRAVDKFNKLYPKHLKTINNSGDVVPF